MYEPRTAPSPLHVVDVGLPGSLESGVLEKGQGAIQAPGTGGTPGQTGSSDARALEAIHPGAAIYRTANVNEWRPDIDHIVGEEVKKAKAAGLDKESCPHASWTAGWWAWHRAWGQK